LIVDAKVGVSVDRHADSLQGIRGLAAIPPCALPRLPSLGAQRPGVVSRGELDHKSVHNPVRSHISQVTTRAAQRPPRTPKQTARTAHAAAHGTNDQSALRSHVERRLAEERVKVHLEHLQVVPAPRWAGCSSRVRQLGAGGRGTRRRRALRRADSGVRWPCPGHVRTRLVPRRRPPRRPGVPRRRKRARKRSSWPRRCSPAA
jgi:hypothetical protein